LEELREQKNQNIPSPNVRIQDEDPLQEKSTLIEDSESGSHEVLKELGNDINPRRNTEKYLEFNCPICGCIVSEDGIKCLDCGLEIVDMDDFSDKDISWKDQEVTEISTMSAAEEAMEEFVKELEELDSGLLEPNEEFKEVAIQFQCPVCYILVDGKDMICPGCGVRFESI
jgi:rubrerythrin